MPASITLGDLVEETARELSAAGIDGARLDARLLVCAAAGASHAQLIADAGRPLDASAAHLARRHAARRCAGEPVSRILGEREFWSLTFSLDHATLDPRPDSETLVHAALDTVDACGWRQRPLHILDLGTGSGCLLTALLHELPLACGVGVDISAAACRMARANAHAAGVAARARFVCASWTDALAGRFDLVVSNPPYIPTADIASLAREVREHDPHAALDGGADGLDEYRRLATDVRRVCDVDGWLLVECGDGQAETVRGLLRQAGWRVPGEAQAVTRDLAGRERCVRAAAPAGGEGVVG